MNVPRPPGAFFPMNDRYPISLLTEIPRELHLSLRDYLDTHPDWDQDRVFTAALSLFLLVGEREKIPAAIESQCDREIYSNY
jgi:hypothetical protein